MNRRLFLVRGAAGASGLLAERIWPSFVWADDLPKDVRVTRVVGFDLPTKRSKVAGKNARLDVHGDSSRDRMLRLYTNKGFEAIGASNADEKAAAKLLGGDPLALFRRDEPAMTGPLGNGTMPLWDLAGKVLKAPAYKLLGGKGRERVPVYDGSIYFADLLPQYADRWRDRFREEIDMSRKLGHVAVKIKIGRGNKWMKRAEGNDRDVEVIKLIRAHAGRDAIVGVDANNGYDLAGALALMDRVGDQNLAFVEELFEEAVEPCLKLKKHMASRGWKTLLADGETQSKLDPFKPLVEAQAVDILQGDMKHFGFEGILAEAAMARPKKILVAPHNWGSLLGYYMQLHVGRAIDNFYRAEHDPLSTDVLIAEGYAIKSGAATVPDAPGFGLALDEKKFAATIRPRFDLRA